MTDFDLDDDEPRDVSPVPGYVDRAHLDKIYQSALYKMEEAQGNIRRWLSRAADERASRRATISGLTMIGLGTVGAAASALVPWLQFSALVSTALIFAGAGLMGTALAAEALLRIKLLGSANDAREAATEAVEQMRKARNSF